MKALLLLTLGFFTLEAATCRPAGARRSRRPAAGRRRRSKNRRRYRAKRNRRKGTRKSARRHRKSAAAGCRFVQYGQATWYGRKFRGRRTASGERFDERKMTAAHRTLPFGTLVRVTRLDTKKQVLVRINDRGPYGKGRIIDLARAAAARLGMLRRGVVRVRLEVVSWPKGRCRRARTRAKPRRHKKTRPLLLQTGFGRRPALGPRKR